MAKSAGQHASDRTSLTGRMAIGALIGGLAVAMAKPELIAVGLVAGGLLPYIANCWYRPLMKCPLPWCRSKPVHGDGFGHFRMGGCWLCHNKMMRRPVAVVLGRGRVKDSKSVKS